MLTRNLETRKINVNLPVAVLIISFGLSNVAIAQGVPTETAEKARALGLSRDMKTLPAGAVTPGAHYSQTPPSNFPVAVYKSNVITTHFLNSTKGAASATLSILTRDQPAAAFQFYQSSLRGAGWSLQIPTQEALNKMAPSGQIYMLKATRDIQETNVMIQAIKERGTMISVNWRIATNTPQK